MHPFRTGFASLTLFAATAPAQSPGFWELRSSLAVARQEIAAAELGGKVYVGGGLLVSILPTDTVEVFDPSTGMWSFAANLPVTRHHFGMAAAGGKLYSIGGYQAAFVGDTLCYEYDPTGNQWTPIAGLPRARGALAAVAISSKIYAVGGVVPGGVGVVGDLTAYDPATNQWQTLAPMPTPREHLAAAAIDGKLYVAGGRRPGQLFATLERYDPATDMWETLTPMPTARGGNGAAVLDGKLIVFGGEGSALPGGNFPDVEEYDPATDSWRTLTNMALPVHGIYPVSIGDEVLVAGGGTVAGFAATNFVLSFRRFPTGVVSYGASTDECNGTIEAFPNLPPFENRPAFRIDCTGAPSSANGWLLIAATPNVAGLPLLNVTLHVGLGPTTVPVGTTSDAAGNASLNVPLPLGFAGLGFFCQYLWFNTGACLGLPSLSSSQALDITIRAGEG